MAGTDETPGGTGTVWVDEQEVDPTWATPGDPPAETPPADGDGDRPGTQPTGRRRRRLLTIGLPILLLVMIILAVVAAGGFEVRPDGSIPVEPGEEFSTGPYVISLEHATVQNAQGYGDHPRIEEVIVYGSARNTWTESLRPNSGDFLGSDQQGTVIDSHLFSLDNESNGPDQLTPGIAMQPITISFEFPPTAELDGDTVRVGARNLVYETDSVFTTSDEKVWSPDGREIQRIDLPLKRLPREEDW